MVLEVTVLTVSVIGVILTQILHVKYKLDNVVASALPSLVVVVIVAYARQFVDSDIWVYIPVAYFGASFAGMSAKSKLSNLVESIISGMVFGGLLLLFSGRYVGYGGGLGTSAAISVLVAISLGHWARWLLRLVQKSLDDRVRKF